MKKNKKKENVKYLPDIKLPENVKLFFKKITTFYWFLMDRL